MPYRITFPNRRDAEPYTDLMDQEDVYAAVKEEADKVINDLGSSILPDPSEATREKVLTLLAVEAFEALWYRTGRYEFPDGTRLRLHDNDR